MIGSQWFFRTSTEAVVGGRWSVSSVFNPMGIKSSSRVLLDARIYRKMFRRSWPYGLLNVLLPHISELVGMEVKAGARGLTF